jgi:hypothetical protein
MRACTKLFICVFHFEGYMVKIIIVTSQFSQDLNISESNLSLSSHGNRGAATLKRRFCVAVDVARKRILTSKSRKCSAKSA